MNKSGEIVLIEDDADDQMMFEETIASMGIQNKVVKFFEAAAAFEYLQRPDVHPFIIVCDINLPGINGVELRNKVFADGGLKANKVPFIFFTTAADRVTLRRTDLEVPQGLFVKPNSYSELQSILRLIVEYWTQCYAPERP